MAKRNYCAACGGILVKDIIRYDKRCGNDVAIFEKVPAETCPQCGEVWIDGKVMEKIERLFLKKSKPQYKISIPVWELKKAA